MVPTQRQGKLFCWKFGTLTVKSNLIHLQKKVDNATSSRVESTSKVAEEKECRKHKT